MTFRNIATHKKVYTNHFDFWTPLSVHTQQSPFHAPTVGGTEPDYNEILKKIKTH